MITHECRLVCLHANAGEGPREDDCIRLPDSLSLRYHYSVKEFFDVERANLTTLQLRCAVSHDSQLDAALTQDGQRVARVGRRGAAVPEIARPEVGQQQVADFL